MVVVSGPLRSSIIGLLRLHSLRESDGFSLLTLVRIEGCDRSHSILSMVDNWEGAVGIIFEFFHSYTAPRYSRGPLIPKLRGQFA